MKRNQPLKKRRVNNPLDRETEREMSGAPNTTHVSTYTPDFVLPLRLRWYVSFGNGSPNPVGSGNSIWTPLVVSSSTTATNSLFKSLRIRSIEVWVPHLATVTDNLSLRLIPSALGIRSIERSCNPSYDRMGHIFIKFKDGDPAFLWATSQVSTVPFTFEFSRIVEGMIVEIRYVGILADGGDVFAATAGLGLTAGRVYQPNLGGTFSPQGRASA